MMLIICRTSPIENANYLIERTNKKFVFKNLLELAQLICSCRISYVYSPVKQGKELQNWITRNPMWVYKYFSRLLEWATISIKLKDKTKKDLSCIKSALYETMRENRSNVNITTAVFRYKKDYTENTTYKTNSELPVEIVIKEYEKYIKWKKELMLV